MRWLGRRVRDTTAKVCETIVGSKVEWYRTDALQSLDGSGGRNRLGRRRRDRSPVGPHRGESHAGGTGPGAQHHPVRRRAVGGRAVSLHAAYPEGMTLRLILDNHSAHIAKETRAFLATVPNRFEFVFTPKHASWLNLVETFTSARWPEPCCAASVAPPPTNSRNVSNATSTHPTLSRWCSNGPAAPKTQSECEPINGISETIH